MNVKKTVLAMIISGAGVTGMAHAGTIDQGSAATADATLSFVSTTDLTNSLTPVSDLKAGTNANMATVAKGEVLSKDGSLHHYAMTFNSGVISMTPDNAPRTVVSGSNNANNKIDLYLVDTTPGTQGFKEVINGKAYAVTDKRDGMEQAKGTYDVRLNGAQNIAADSYTLSTVAYIYTA